MSQAMQADADVCDVAAGLAQARDAQIARVVAMVDHLPERGSADALIEPLRARLAQLRPVRPFGFTRLLFSPLDPVIVPSQRWKRGEIGVPRPALAPLGQAMKMALPKIGQALESSTCLVTPGDRVAIAALGAGLWPAAAAVLEHMPPPANWAQESGLAVDDFAELATTLAAVLRQAGQIEAVAASFQTPDEGAIRAILTQTEPSGPLALATTVAVLLARLGGSARVLALSSKVGARHDAADRAVDYTLAGLQAAMGEGAVDRGSAADAAAEAGRVAALLSGMEDDATLTPERRQRLEHIRSQADGLCLRRFDQAIATTLTHAAATAATGYDDATLSSLESAARDLRRLEGAGRHLGSGGHYDAGVQTMAAKFRDPASGLPLVDRVRMVEILSGSDEALALLQSQ